MITSAILMIATLIIIAMLISGVLPQIFGAAGSITSSSGGATDRLETSGTVVNYDIVTPGTLQFDVLNDGKASLAPAAINMTVAYLYNETSSPGALKAGADPDEPYWAYVITGDADQRWDPGEVLEVRVVSPAGGFAPGDYQLKLLLFNGAIVQYGFTI